MRLKNLWNCAQKEETRLLSIINHIAAQFGLPNDEASVMKDEMKEAMKRYVDGQRKYLISINGDKSVTVKEELN